LRRRNKTGKRSFVSGFIYMYIERENKPGAW